MNLYITEGHLSIKTLKLLVPYGDLYRRAWVHCEYIGNNSHAKCRLCRNIAGSTMCVIVIQGISECIFKCFDKKQYSENNFKIFVERILQRLICFIMPGLIYIMQFYVTRRFIACIGNTQVENGTRRAAKLFPEWNE